MSEDKPVILIVDDELNNRELLAAMLQAKGYSTLTASDGRTALRTAAEQSPDLILLDVMMPGMDGYQVAENLKQDSATAPIPIVMISALDDQESRLSGLESGAEEYLAKPIERTELLVRVKNMLLLKKYRDFYLKHNNESQP